MNLGLEKKSIQKIRHNSRINVLDAVVVEEPLEIRLNNKSVAITMRTPGADKELALGFLYNEGILKSLDDVAQAHACPPKPPATRSNIFRIELNEHCRLDTSKLDRHFYTTSSCGVCGKASIEALAFTSNYPPTNDFFVNTHVINELPNVLQGAQQLFRETGGIHAAALFLSSGDLVEYREDVGRHNALDKLIGWALLNNQLPLQECILLVSGRTSFELVQKSAMAGLAVVGGIGAPSSLAVDLGREKNITLLGFVKKNGFNIYTHSQRIKE